MTTPVLSDYQLGLEGSGLILGADTDYVLKSWKGLGLQGMRTNRQPRPFAHGETAGPEYMSSKTVDVDLHIKATSAESVVSKVDAFVGGWYLDARGSQTYGVMDKLHVKLPGQDQRFLYGRPQRSDADPDNFVNGWCPAAGQFYASDPLWYSSALQSGVMNLSVAPSGRGFNKSFDYGWGGTATAGVLTAVNSGNAPTLPVFTLTGPLTNVTLLNETTGQSLTLTYTLGSGETLVVDFREATIKLGGTASRYSAKTGGTFWEIAAGTNTLRFQAQSGSGTATIEWRHAWR